MGTVLMRGIDVSTHQKGIDWKKVYNAGYRFAFIRVGYRGYTNGSMNEDKYFKANIEGASKVGMKIGLYFFSTAISEKEAIEDARFVLDRIGNYKVELPIVFDFEGYEEKKYRTYGCTKAQRTAYCKAFADTVIKAGYNTMLYGSKGNIRTTYDCDKLLYPMWIAQYTGGYKKIIDDEKYFPKMGAYIPRVAIWQYTSIGNVPGISGNVDLNKMYIDVSDSAPQTTVPTNPYTMPSGVIKFNKLTQYIAKNSVRWMQWELVQAGYDLKIDGKFGKKTLAALKDYQKKHGLVVDGKCGPKTKNAMLND